MRRKLTLALLLLLILCFDVAVRAKTTNNNAAFSLDGVSAAQRRHKRRRHRRNRQRAKATENISAPDEGGGSAPSSEPMVGSSPMSAPPARKAAPIDVSRPGASKPNTAPGIKPPTVQIKPPTR